ncbi:MAG: PKD domain-containing protein [bacterium]
MKQLPITLVRAASAAAVIALVGCGHADQAMRPSSIALRTDLTPAATDPVVVTAGDIACGTTTAPGTPCKQAQTGALIGQIGADAVIPLGDNQYENGTLLEFNNFYGPTWGVYKSITWPVVGNHEYQTPGATGYFDYFNGIGVQTGRAGDRLKGYYSFNLGAWHVVVLNSNCSIVNCSAGSAQEQWLRADLAANPVACTLAAWHHPRFSSGVHNNDASTQALWQALYDNHADVVINGHDHDYERFAPQTPTGALDNTNGVRSFVIGTGGKEQRGFATIRPNSQFRSNTSLGVLKLVLHPTSFDWQFVPVPGDPLNDAGTATCNTVGTSNQAPTAVITAPLNNASFAQGASVSFAGTGTDPEDGALSGASLVWTSSRDGQIGTGTSFSKSNLSVGVHTITLTAKDANGATGTATRTITITSSNQAPSASFTFNCTGQGSPLQCVFDASASTDDAGIVSYNWNWGDGRSETRVQPTSRNTWASAGTYSVTLKVTDGGGLTSTVVKQITVPAVPTNQPPVARFTWTCTAQAFPHQCALDASTSTDDTGIVSYKWSWGNGKSETKVQPLAKNSWATAGTYDVTLVVTDGSGPTSTVTNAVVVP